MHSCRFDSWSGHVPGFQAQSLIGSVQKAADPCFPSHFSFLLSKSIKNLKHFTIKTHSSSLLCGKGPHRREVVSLKEAGGWKR